MVKFVIPESLKIEHKALHEELSRAIEVKGDVGDAARAVAEVLHPHFMKEEEFAFPPLGLLQRLMKEGVTPEMRDVLKMTDRFREELPVMLDEHKAIVAELKGLTDAATKAGKLEQVRFAEKLELHAQTEEEVYYPTNVLIGEYVKRK